MPGQSSRRSKSSRRRLRRNRLVFEGPGAEDGLAVLDRRLRVPAREGMPREEAILEEPGRRHVEVIGYQKLQNHHSTRSLSSLGLCSHEPHGWRCGAAQCVFRDLTNSSAGLEVLAPRPWRFKVIYLASPPPRCSSSLRHPSSIYLWRQGSISLCQENRPLRLTG